MKKIIILTIISLLSLFNCNNNPVQNEKPENHYPEILSLSVFQNIIGLKDSVIVFCTATDPDGDTLVYDWYTDARLKINGANGNESWLIHTFDNYRVFYPTKYNYYPVDTAWVQCFVRDVRGGEVGRMIRLIVNQNLGCN